MKKNHNDEFVSARKHASLTTGEVIRMLRELKGWTQDKLAEKSGLNAKNILITLLLIWRYDMQDSEII